MATPQLWTQKCIAIFLKENLNDLIPLAIQYFVKQTRYLGFTATFMEKGQQLMFSQWGVVDKMLEALRQRISHRSVPPCIGAMASERNGAPVKEIVTAPWVSASQTQYRPRTNTARSNCWPATFSIYCLCAHLYQRAAAGPRIWQNITNAAIQN